MGCCVDDVEEWCGLVDLVEVIEFLEIGKQCWFDVEGDDVGEGVVFVVEVGFGLGCVCDVFVEVVEEGGEEDQQDCWVIVVFECQNDGVEVEGDVVDGEEIWQQVGVFVECFVLLWFC